MCAAVAYPISQQRFWRPYLVDGMEPQPQAYASFGATLLEPDVVVRSRSTNSKAHQPLGFGSITDQERQAYLNDPATKGVIPLQLDNRIPISPPVQTPPAVKRQRSTSSKSSSKSKDNKSATAKSKTPSAAHSDATPAASDVPWSNGGEEERHEVHEFYCFARNKTIQYFTPPKKRYSTVESNCTPDENLRKVIMGGFEKKKNNSWKYGIFHHLYEDPCPRSKKPFDVPPVQRSAPPISLVQNPGLAPQCSSSSIRIGAREEPSEFVVEAKRRKKSSSANPTPTESMKVRPREEVEQQQQQPVGPDVKEKPVPLDRFYFSENPGSYKIKTIWRVAHMRDAEA